MHIYRQAEETRIDQRKDGQPKTYKELRKLWARIEIKLVVEPCLSAESQFLLYFPLHGFCIYVTEHSLNTGRNMQQIWKDNKLN